MGATLNVIPYFFYDLTEIKQKAMVTVLKIRALFEDYGNGVLSDAALVEAIDIIEEAKIYHDKNIVKPTKDEIKKAKKAKDKAFWMKQNRKQKIGSRRKRKLVFCLLFPLAESVKNLT